VAQAEKVRHDDEKNQGCSESKRVLNIRLSLGWPSNGQLWFYMVTLRETTPPSYQKDLKRKRVRTQTRLQDG